MDGGYGDDDLGLASGGQAGFVDDLGDLDEFDDMLDGLGGDEEEDADYMLAVKQDDAAVLLQASVRRRLAKRERERRADAAAHV